VTADLAIIGSGIVGAWTAYLAAREHPGWEIAVLDRGQIAEGATAWSAGVDFPLAATPGHRGLVEISRAEYEALAGTAAATFRTDLPMIYVVDERRVDSFAATVLTVLRPVTAAERKSVFAVIPDVKLRSREVLLTHDGYGAIIRARPMALALLNAAADRVSVQTGQAITSVTRTAHGYRLSGEGVCLEATRVIGATGPWSLAGPLSALTDRGNGARVKRVAALHADLPVQADDPLVYFVDDDLFIAPVSAGHALVSFRRDAWDVDPDTLDGKVDSSDVTEGLAVLASRSAQGAAVVTGGRAFCDLYLSDRLPTIGTHASMPGAAVAFGGSGSGVRLAPGLATKAVSAVNGR
jgi:glycine/D-amino acid oxidase-like deaminating enzyme